MKSFISNNIFSYYNEKASSLTFLEIMVLSTWVFLYKYIGCVYILGKCIFTCKEHGFFNCF